MKSAATTTEPMQGVCRGNWASRGSFINLRTYPDDDMMDRPSLTESGSENSNTLMTLLVNIPDVFSLM